MEADRRHTTTGFENRKSCFQSCLDLAHLIVDGDPQTLERPGRDVDVTRPGLPRDRGFDRLSQIASSSQRAPRHDEMGDPASPTLLAVSPQDALDLGGIEMVDDPFRRELRA